MSASLLIVAAAVVLPLAALEARRVWMNHQRDKLARAAWVAKVQIIDEVQEAERARFVAIRPYWADATVVSLPDSEPVWMGYDHGSECYSPADPDACGTSSDISTCGGDA